MGDLISAARMLLEMNDLPASLEIVNTIIRKKELHLQDAFLLRARIHFKMQNWGDAMNDYFCVLEIDPENKEAKSGIEMAKSILGYFTPDMFNP